MNAGDYRLRGELRNLVLLDELEGSSNVSQRDLANRLGLAVSLVNRQVRSLKENGYIQVVDQGVRPFAYRLTADGRRYRRRLSHEHYRSVLGSLRQVQERIRNRLRELEKRGVDQIVFYGAGEVMEVAYPLAKAIGMRVVGVVDDDPSKHGQTRGEAVIQSPAAIDDLAPDAIVITSFRHAAEIQSKIPPALRSSLLVFEV
ncbi:MAG: winged helix-turn-helix transcriptional regulator [Gemmatimonadetes bacterium]|nr:winged helix-turn-helix transcriptional regulator [Gemmatimonadota bacterium]